MKVNGRHATPSYRTLAAQFALAYGDMSGEGILDPAKMTRLALQNAASVAGLLLTTEVMIAEAPKVDDHAHGGAPGGMGGMD